MTKSNREHAFDCELAEIVGIEKAILLKNISYWVAENERRKQTKYFSNGRWWTEESLTSLAKKYPYMRRASIGRWMNELAAHGWISMRGTSGGQNKYATGRVFDAWNAGLDWQAEMSAKPSQNETGDRPKMRYLPSQNGTPTVPKWDTDRPKMGYNNIDNVDPNVELSADKPRPVPIKEMTEAFEARHQRHFRSADGHWIGFAWKDKEFAAMKKIYDELKKRMAAKNLRPPGDDEVVEAWGTFLDRAATADKFILQNLFTPSKLWGDFQGIMNKITGANTPAKKPQRGGIAGWGSDPKAYAEPQAF